MGKVRKPIKNKTDYILIAVSMIVLGKLMYDAQTIKNKILYLVCILFDISLIIPKCLEDWGYVQSAEKAKQVYKVFGWIIIIFGAILVVGSIVGLWKL